ncbi:MAG: hypothetical protein JWM68_2490 [Verrucomicrobiales bacterium]|nr:hypothetical protein [Verrucomicrobiales bacterium]
MIRDFGVRDGKTNRNFIEEAIAEIYRALREIISHKENQFIFPRFHFAGGKQRQVSAAIGVCHETLQETFAISVSRPEFDFHVPRRTAVGRIEDMRAEFR